VIGLAVGIIRVGVYSSQYYGWLMVKRTFSWLIVLIIAFLVVVASLIMTMRIALPKISEYPTEISTYLSKQLNARVSIESIEAIWLQSKPQIQINNVKIVDLAHDSRAVAINTVVAELDVVQSIASFSPVFKHLTIDGFSLRAEQINSRWLTVFSPVSDTTLVAPKNYQGADQLLRMLLNQSQIVFKNASLVLNPEYRPKRIVGPVQFVMDNTEDMHQLSGTAELKYYGDHSSVEFALEARQLAPKIFDTGLNVYAKFNNISEQLFALNLWDIGVDVNKMSLDSQVWATLKNGLVSDVVGDATINSLYFDDDRYPGLVDSHMNFSLSTERDEHSIYLSNIQISDGNSSLSIPALSSIFSATLPRTIKKIAVSEVDLNALSTELLKQRFVSDKLKKVLQALKLKGRLANLVVTWGDSKLSEFKLQADMHNVAINEYAGAPQLSGVTGLLEMTALEGRIDLDTQALSMHFPRLYAQKWDYKAANGVVSWKINRGKEGVDSVSVGSHLLSITQEDMRAQGRFSLVLPMDLTQQAELILMLGMREAPVAEVLNYLPGKIVGKELTQWLNKAALAGRLEEGGFVLRTGIRKDVTEPVNASVQMYYKLQDSRVNFDPNWPNLSADDLQVSYFDGDLAVSSNQGVIAANTVSQLSVIKDATASALSINAFIAGDVAKLYSKIQTKPALKLLPEAIQGWELKGEHLSAIALTIPLLTKNNQSAPQSRTKNAKPKFHLNLATELKNVSLNDQSLKLHATKARGKIAFDTIKGLSSNEISLSTFGHPAKLSITSKPNNNVLKTTVALTGKIAIKDVKPWLDTKHFDRLEGSAAFGAKFDFCSEATHCNQLLINTNLAGVSVDLPAPWGKSAKQQRKLQILKSNAQQRGPIWRYNYADIVRGVTKLATVSAAGGNAYTTISLGGERPDLQAGPGVHVTGVLNDIDLDTLLPYLSIGGNEGATIVAESNATASQFKRLDLSLNNVKIFGRELSRAQVNLRHNQGRFQGRFNTALATGNIVIPKDKNQSIQLVLKSLNVPHKRLGEAQQHSENKWLVSRNLQPFKWPKVSVLIERLIYKNQDIGQWSSQLSPTKTGFKASHIKGSIAGTNITGEVAFSERRQAVKSFMKLTAKGGDFGELLTQLGFGKVLESESGELQANLSWQGYPWGISQANLNGRLDFSMANGRIIEAGTSANFLRIFGILNLNTVIKRLKLDFSDLLESGIAFDKVTAKYYLEDGIATTEEPLKLEGSSASVEMAGTINLANESLEQKMLVAIPLTSNAPLAALLLATPQVAGIAFVVDQLLGKQLAKLTALRYGVSGPWSNPKVSPIVAGAKKK